MSDTKNYEDKILFFDSNQDLEKKLELARKILPLTNGYTLNQIERAFESVLIDLKTGFLINLLD